MVAGAGFEPDVSFYRRVLMRHLSLTTTLTRIIDVPRGFEPQLDGPKPPVLPLY